MCKKNILLIFLLICLIPLANALDICTDTKEISQPCQMMTPSMNCTDYNYSILSTNGTIVETGNLTLVNLTVYSFNFTQGEGDYVIYLCDETTREVRVTTEDDTLIAIILMFAISIIFFSILGFVGKVGFLKYASYSLAFIEMVIGIGLIYVNYAGADITGLLRINFYCILIIGIGLLLGTLFLKPAQMIESDDWDAAPKWGGK